MKRSKINNLVHFKKEMEIITPFFSKEKAVIKNLEKNYSGPLKTLVVKQCVIMYWKM